ncbi:hypothetical protein FEP96_05457 [Burkholderia multivorans]|nr:hypothetical protein [Burkholderia multivorans]
MIPFWLFSVPVLMLSAFTAISEPPTFVSPPPTVTLVVVPFTSPAFVKFDALIVVVPIDASDAPAAFVRLGADTSSDPASTFAALYNPFCDASVALPTTFTAFPPASVSWFDACATSEPPTVALPSVTFAPFTCRFCDATIEALPTSSAPCAETVTFFDPTTEPLRVALAPDTPNCPATMLLPLSVTVCPACKVVSPFDDTPATATLPLMPLTLTVPIDATPPASDTSFAA